MPLPQRPYDLRHAGVPLWPSSGAEPIECAHRAGHSVAVPFRVYAKALAQPQDRAGQKIDTALRDWGGNPLSPGGHLGDTR